MASNEQSAIRTAIEASSEPGALWVCPTPAALTTAAVAAALYAFSDLIDEQADPELATVREELCFLVTLHGTAAIERVADALAVHGPGSLPENLGTRVPLSTVAPVARLAWCRRQALALAKDSEIGP